MTVALDGTIDNRAELTTVLRADFPSRRCPDQLQLVLAAYRRWGLNFPRHLLGEFALVLWDDSEKRLLAARDPFGVRSLFYRIGRESILIGSQLRQLLNPSERSPSFLDEEYLADFLAFPFARGGRTAFTPVSRLEASHALLVQEGRVRTFKYWDLEAGSEDTTWSDSACLERFRELFREAVAVQLDSPGRVWAELSGGLDSSSIVSMAQTLRRNNGRGTSELGTLSFIWPNSPRSDERKWAEEVMARHEVRGYLLPGDDKFFSGALEASRYRDDPHFGLLMHPLFKAEADLLQRAGVDVLLSGGRAESVVLHEAQKPLHLADLLKGVKLKSFWQQISRWQESLEAPMLSLLWAYALRPLMLPNRIPESWDNPFRIDPWITVDFSRRMNLTDRKKRVVAPRKFRRPSDQIHFEYLRSWQESAGLGYLGWSVEARFPYLYRPLVEFAFSVPWESKICPGQDKRLIREGLAGILPHRIRKRRTWKSPTYAAFQTLRRRWPEISALGESSILVELGIFDHRRWNDALNRARHGASENFGSLTSCMALEYWLRSLFGAPSDSESGLSP